MANEMQKTTPFGMRDKVGYMFGDFANDFTFILSSSFLMKFYTDVMGVSAGVVGMIMMIARFVDAFTDVTMGQIVDRSKPTRDGKFRPWLKRMCGPVAIASFLIFQSGLAGMSYGFKVAWLFVTYILWGSIFYTSVNIPYGSMASAISADPKDRAELSTLAYHRQHPGQPCDRRWHPHGGLRHRQWSDGPLRQPYDHHCRRFLCLRHPLLPALL